MKKIEIFNINMPKSIKIVKPTGFLDFIQLESNANLILTDSGGLQEEACALKIPCVTLRDSTERPETVDVGANIVSGIEPEDIVRCSDRIILVKKKWRNPFGNGRSAIKILDILKKDNDI